jgi:parvulin-like peptidyl-prolyl isomerase
MRILREPLFHFLLLGLAIFAWYALVAPPSDGGEVSDQIVIDQRDVQLIVERFEATWRRPPTVEELQGLIDSLLREEIMVREARKLGLDQGDSVVRQRLRQKMEFLATSVAQSMQPTEAELQEHLDANPERFVLPPQIAFEQVYLGQAATEAEVSAMLEALQGGADPGTLGRASLLPPALSLSTPRAVESSFGRGMFEALQAQPSGVWSGPVESGFGTHLVRVTDVRPAETPALEDISQNVLLDWRRVQNETIGTAQLEALAEGYDIVVPEAASLEGLEN